MPPAATLSCRTGIAKSTQTFRFRRKFLELLGGFPPTGINFDSATQLAKTKNHPAGWFPFWSCWADSNRRPHPYQIFIACFFLLPLFVPCSSEVLVSLVLRGFFTVPCCRLLCLVCCGFLVTVAVLLRFLLSCLF